MGTQNRQDDKEGLHPRNRHRGRYDFPELIGACPDLAGFVRPTPYGEPSIDFADPDAVRTLNRALLQHFYGVCWDLPERCLCPPVPGRADHIHHLADLLAGANGGAIPRGPGVRVLDIGVGANCIYPLLGHREYGWRFLGSDIDPRALAIAARTLRANPGLEEAIQLRLQPEPAAIFQGLLREGERFDLAMCNPPFHASAAEAREGTRRKLDNLSQSREGARRQPEHLSRTRMDRTAAPVLNFGGQGAELWCPGGEAGFVARMIEESARIPTRCLWFSSLVSRAANLPGIRHQLRQAGASAVRTLEMTQGQKKSRIVAWTFQGDGRYSPVAS